MSEETKPFAFEPITYDKCPHCNSTERVTKVAWDEEVAKGKLPKEITPSLGTVTLPLIDQRKPPPAFFSILACYFDICLKCGTMYCWRIERRSGNILQPRMPGRGGAPIG